jgi:late competence protein required for DNA uptake (superfamily II DNA/RNA helicase)
MKLQCPTCGESANAIDYTQDSAHPIYCWECLCFGRGWVKLELVEFLRARPASQPPATPTSTPTEQTTNPTKKKVKKAAR